jgi:hypothetical protein
MDTTTEALGKRLRDAAESAGPAPISGLKSQKYSGDCSQGSGLARIILRVAEVCFAAAVALSFHLIQKLFLRIQNLRQTRDLLLSGRANLATN